MVTSYGIKRLLRRIATSLEKIEILEAIYFTNIESVVYILW